MILALIPGLACPVSTISSQMEARRKEGRDRVIDVRGGENRPACLRFS